MPPSPRKRRTLEGDENEIVNVIAPTPRKSPRTGNAASLETTPTDSASNRITRNGAAAMIPPSEAGNHPATATDGSLLLSPPGRAATSETLKDPSVRRAIQLDDASPVEPVPPVTPKDKDLEASAAAATVTPPPEVEKAAKRRLIFGKFVEEVAIQPNTKRVYGLVKRLTGSLGGNGSCGPIYGELTKGSMQRMVNLMVEHTQLNSQSRFIDVGSGIGKPNLHVAQDPGVAFSCGIEMELDRFRLGLKCLQSVIEEAVKDAGDDTIEPKIQHKCMFLHGNIMAARTFDPFTHVYMFSIGFPPKLWVYLSEAWNRSKSPYLICFHGPRVILNKYGFKADLVAQIPTSMHASGEGHTGYIYKRKGMTPTQIERYIAKSPCDKVFKEAYQQVESGLENLRHVVDKEVEEHWSSKGRSMTRSQARKHGVVLSKEK